MNEPYQIEIINTINAQCYDAKADQWDRFPFPNLLIPWVKKYHHPASGNKALEIGSGTGQFAAWLASQGFEVLCLDPSTEMVRRCREKKLNTFQRTIQQHVDEQKYGIISAILSFIHLPKSEMPVQLKKIHDWLNPNGIFLLAMIEGEGEKMGEASTSHPRFFAYYTKQEILNMLAPEFECLEEATVGSTIKYLVFAFRKK